MISNRAGNPRRELGEFLRAHRERLTPAAFGLAGGTRRRTPGLRREEVAQLGGLSTTWYTWIEQGRDVAVSPAALARLARTLQLSRAERAYLFDLAGRRDPDQGGQSGETLPAAALASVTAIRCPAYLLDRYWNARSWNSAAERLFTGWLDQPGERNLLHFIFLHPAARSLIDPWEERARRIAAEFRAGCSPHQDDLALRRLIEDLHRESAEFARFWDEYGVLGREGGERRFRHPSDGPLRYQQVTFTLAGDADLKLTMLLDDDVTGAVASSAAGS